MKIVIIDDESKARRLLSNILTEIYGERFQLFQAANLVDGVELIRKEEAEIVLLDIQMPKYSGLEITRFFANESINFQIIFTTAHNQYALEAFRASATDYLLKPIDHDELERAIDQAVSNQSSRVDSKRLEKLEQAFLKLSLNKIALEVPKGYFFVSHDDIILFEADGMYTKAYLANKRVELICKPLKHFVEQLLSNNLFYRPHRSYLINLKHIKEVKKGDGFYIVMKNDKLVKVARDKKGEFLKMIERVF